MPKRAKRGGKKLLVGTSGWTYDDWNGVFYPEGVKGAERLSYYAERFDTVEVNATFYRFPNQAMIGSWNRRLPSGFHLVLKGHRGVTHRKKLKDCDDLLGDFIDRVMELKRLRVLLWQLPPNLHKDVERLEQFLSSLPGRVRHAVEFRHPSWWDDEVAGLLESYRACFVAVSHPELPDDILPTADFLYLRFHGLGPELYRYDYSEEELRRWARNARAHLKGRTLYAFFNNDYEANAPRNARTFLDLLK